MQRAARHRGQRHRQRPRARQGRAADGRARTEGAGTANAARPGARVRARPGSRTTSRRCWRSTLAGRWAVSRYAGGRVDAGAPAGAPLAAGCRSTTCEPSNAGSETCPRSSSVADLPDGPLSGARALRDETAVLVLPIRSAAGPRLRRCSGPRRRDAPSRRPATEFGVRARGAGGGGLRERVAAARDARAQEGRAGAGAGGRASRRACFPADRCPVARATSSAAFNRPASQVGGDYYDAMLAAGGARGTVPAVRGRRVGQGPAGVAAHEHDPGDPARPARTRRVARRSRRGDQRAALRRRRPGTSTRRRFSRDSTRPRERSPTSTPGTRGACWCCGRGGRGARAVRPADRPAARQSGGRSAPRARPRRHAGALFGRRHGGVEPRRRGVRRGSHRRRAARSARGTAEPAVAAPRRRHRRVRRLGRAARRHHDHAARPALMSPAEPISACCVDHHTDRSGQR